MRRTQGRFPAPLASVLLLWPLLLAAQEAPPASPAGGASPEELAKKLSNPVAAMISVPFQNNFEFGIGPDLGFRWTLNFQPVVPLKLSPRMNLIVRTIAPVIQQSDVILGEGSQFGLGDITQSFFFSPSGGGIIWAIGPVLFYPSATESVLGAKKWGAGPTGLILKQDGPWTYGILANHIWSYANASGGATRDELSNTFLQPFLSYTNRCATTFNVSTESSYDWIHRQWTVPLNALVSQLVKLGTVPVSIGLGYKYYAKKADNGPDWGLRFVFTVLLPS